MYHEIVAAKAWNSDTGEFVVPCDPDIATADVPESFKTFVKSCKKIMQGYHITIHM